MGDQCDERDEERINQSSKSTACDSLSLHWRPASHHLLRRDRNSHKEEADESGSGAGASDEEVEEFRRNHDVYSFLDLLTLRCSPRSCELCSHCSLLERETQAMHSRSCSALYVQTVSAKMCVMKAEAERMSHPAESVEVLVIGGGVIGSSIAYHVARQGRNVLVVERNEIAVEPAASWASAGGIRLWEQDPAQAALV